MQTGERDYSPDDAMMTDESQEAFTRPPSVNAASALVRSSQRAAPAHPYFRSSTIPIFPSGPVVSPSILHDAVPPTAGISTDAHALTRTEGSAASGSPIKPATQYPGFNRSHGNDDVPNFWASASAGPFYRPSPVGFSFSPRGEPKRQRFGDTETPKSGPFSPSSGAFPPMLSSSSTHIRAMEEWIIALVDPESLRTIIEDSDAMSECVGGVPGLSGCTSQPFIHPTGGCSKVILRQFSRSLPCHHRSPTPSHSGHPAPHATSDRESGPSSFRAPTARCDGGGGGGGHAVPASRPPHDCTSMLQNQPTNPTSARLVAVADVASAAVLVFEQLPDGHNLDDDTVERLITQAKHVSDRRLLAAAGRGGTGGTKKRKGRDEGGHARRSLQEGPDRVSVGLDDRMRLFWKMIHAVIMTPTAGYRGWMDCTPRHLEQVRPHGRQIHAHTPISPTAAPSLWDSPERLALTKHVERYHGPELAKQCRQLGPSPLLPMQHFVDIVLDARVRWNSSPVIATGPSDSVMRTPYDLFAALT